MDYDTSETTELEGEDGPRATAFLRDGRSRFRLARGIGLVPSNYENAWRMLRSLPRGRLCEWGSGLGIVVGLAEILGFQAWGIESNDEWALLSRQLLADHALAASIVTGDYLESRDQADYYYVYAWPGEHARVIEHFLDVASPTARLLFCASRDQLRCWTKTQVEALRPSGSG
jgi:hypothetical protein